MLGAGIHEDGACVAVGHGHVVEHGPVNSLLRAHDNDHQNDSTNDADSRYDAGANSDSNDIQR